MAWHGLDFGSTPRHLRRVAIYNSTATSRGCATVIVERADTPGGTWTTVATFSAQPTDAGTVAMLDLPASAAYRCWRWRAGEAPANAGAWVIGEVAVSEEQAATTATQVGLKPGFAAFFAAGKDANGFPVDQSLALAGGMSSAWAALGNSATRYLYLDRTGGTSATAGFATKAPTSGAVPPPSGANTFALDGTTLAGATTSGQGTMQATSGAFSASSYGTATDFQYRGPGSAWDLGFDATGDFTLTVPVGWTNSSSAEMGRLGVDVQDSTGTTLATIGLRDGSDSSAATTCEAFLGSGGPQADGLATPAATSTPANTLDATLTIARVGANWTFTGPGGLNHTAAGSTATVRKIRIRLEAYGISGSPSPATRANVDGITLSTPVALTTNESHWFDTLAGRMMVWSGAAWTPTASPRLFVGWAKTDASGNITEVSPAAMLAARAPNTTLTQVTNAVTTSTTAVPLGNTITLHTHGGRVRLHGSGAMTFNGTGAMYASLWVNGVMAAEQPVYSAATLAPTAWALTVDVELPPGRHVVSLGARGTGGTTTYINGRVVAQEVTT